MRLIFDIETDNLLSSVTRIHCIVGRYEDGSGFLWVNDDNLEVDLQGLNRVTLSEALNNLESASQIIGHNIQGFDIPVIKKITGRDLSRVPIWDTKIVSSLIWSDIQADDSKAMRIPSNLWGKHSLESWGWRLGIRKGDYLKTNGFSELTKEMVSYCIQDIAVTVTLWKHQLSQKYSERAIQLEHDFAAIIRQQENHGFPIDMEALHSLIGRLTARKNEIDSQLGGLFPPRVEQLKTKVKLHPFNPNSRAQIAYNLTKKYGWKPTQFTEGGKPKLDESVLAELDYPEAKALTESLLLKQRLGQLALGDEAILVHATANGGVVHGQVETNGTPTGRCRHYKPNFNLPRVGSDYGDDIRGLFIAGPGLDLVGVDVSGLELRCLSHYLAEFDGGAYANIVCNGDVHTINQQAAGLPTRNDAKTFILTARMTWAEALD